MKHKHADIIHQWADGAEIQRHVGVTGRLWIDDKDPNWHPDNEYRIKPEEMKPVVRWLWAYQITSGGYELTSFSTEREALTYPLVLTKLEWSRTEFTE